MTAELMTCAGDLVKKKSRFVMGMDASAIALLTVWSAGTSAQSVAQSTSESQSQSKADDTADFQEVVVTARRRVERLQDVPVAVTAFTSEDLARYQTNSFQQIAALSPELQIGETGSTGGAVISLRGVGSPSAGPSIDQAVSINVDGIQFSQAQALRLGLNDIERVEVLKGPQALFFGKNSPAGVISITSNGPSDKFEASIRGGDEFENQRKYVEGIISGPLTDTIGGRFDFAYGNQKGWFRNDATPIPAVPVPAFLGGKGELTDAGAGSTQSTGPDQSDVSVRGTLSYKAPNGFVDGTLKINYGRIDRNNGTGGPQNQFAACAGGAPQYVTLLGSAGSRDCTLNRTYNETNISPAILAMYPVFDQNDGKQFYLSNQQLVSGTLNFHLADHLTLTSVTGYYDLKEKETGNFALGDLDFVEPYGTIELKQYSQELRLLSSFSSPLNFLVGGYYQHVDNHQANLAIFGSPLVEALTGGFLDGYQVIVHNQEAETTSAYSFFSQGMLDVTSQVQLTAGGRYSRERKTQEGDLLAPQVFTTTPVYDVPFAVPERSFANFSPELTATYKPMRSLTLYAAYRTGFKSGGFDLNQGTIQFGIPKVGNNSFEQEKVKGFEGGAKGSLFDHQMIFDIAAYRFKYTGLQVSAFDSTTFGYRVTNAASSIVQGVELATQYRPAQLRGLSLRGAINYNDAHYLLFSNAPCYTGESIAQGCAFVSSAASPLPVGPGQVANLQNLSGFALHRAPAWTGNIGTTYEFALPNEFAFLTSIDGIYTDSYNASEAHDIRAQQAPATRLNASLLLRSPGDHWEIALIGTNLTQRIRSANAYGLVGTGSRTGTPAAIGSDLVESPSEVRTVALQGTYKY